jgi:hypothetical protein
VGEEPLFTSPLPHTPLRRVRSTLLVASYRNLVALGRDGEYKTALPLQHHGTILEAVAGTWVELDVAVAHYRACDTLGLTPEQQVDIGRGVGQNLRGTLAGTVVQMSKKAGLEPWTVIETMPRFWGRLFEGSAIVGWKIGPKDVRIDTLQMPLVDFAYFRNALRGQLMGMVDLFCTRSFANPSSTRFSPGTYSLRVQWA